MSTPLVIAVDTGNRFMKTAHAEPFSAGLNRHYDYPPVIATDTLKYKGNYYSFSETQGYHRKDKTVDDYYFILTLAAIAREIVLLEEIDRVGEENADFKKAMKEAERNKAVYKKDIFLSVGLPPRDMKLLSKKFKNYFMTGETLVYTYNNIYFEINITDVAVYPQGFAAVLPNDIYSKVIKYPQAYIIDIGGYTTDIACVANKKFAPDFFESLEFGVIHLYNEISAIVAKDCSLNINGVLIEAVLKGESTGREEVDTIVRKYARTYAHKLIAALRDKQIDLELSLPVLIGGGTQLLKDSLIEAIGHDRVLVIEDVKANAIGYEVIAKRLLKEKEKKAALAAE